MVLRYAPTSSPVANDAFVLGVNRFSFDIKAMIGTRPSLFWRVIWYFISPMFLIVRNELAVHDERPATPFLDDPLLFHGQFSLRHDSHSKGQPARLAGQRSSLVVSDGVRADALHSRLCDLQIDHYTRENVRRGEKPVVTRFGERISFFFSVCNAPFDPKNRCSNFFLLGRSPPVNQRRRKANFCSSFTTSRPSSLFRRQPHVNLRS